MTGTADFNYEDFDQARQAEQDEKLLVKFYTKSRKDNAASEEAGRPIFKEVEFIDIRVPGMRGAGAARPATERDKSRFPRHYAAYKERTELPAEGTPLAEWTEISRSLAEELAFINIKTVEQLATVADTAISDFMGGFTFKQKAIDWLERANRNVQVDKLEQALLLRDKQIADLNAKLEALMADKPKRRKRRTREEIERDNERERVAEQGGGGSRADA